MERVKYFLISALFLLVMPVIVKAETLEIGKYVKIIPYSSSYTVSSELSGYSTDQEINPSELQLWRVIKIYDDGKVDVVSEYTSSMAIYFSGLVGYANYVGEMNKMSQQYMNSKYTVGARMIGYGGQTEYITDTDVFNDISKEFSTPNLITGTGEEYENGIFGDTLYLNDYLLIKGVYGNLIANAVNDPTVAQNYWLASRYFFHTYNYSPDLMLKGRSIDKNGDIENCSIVWHMSSSGFTSPHDFYPRYLRPILTLKSNLTISSGNGSKENPYNLIECSNTMKKQLDGITLTEGDVYDEVSKNALLKTLKLTFKSSDTSVASIDENGVVTAKKEGTATLTATTTDECGGYEITAKVVVKKKAEVKSDEEKKSEDKKVTKGSTINLATGDSFDLSNKVSIKDNTKWTSSDTNIATVDENGKVTVLKTGTVVISAMNDKEEFTNQINVYKKVTSETSNKSVSVLANDDLTNSNVKLSVNLVSESDKKFDEFKNKIKDLNKMTMYDVTLTENNNKVQPNGEVILEFDIPNGYDKSKLAVYRVEDDETLTSLEAEIVNGKIQAKTNHFSYYIVTELNNETNITENGTVAQLSKDTKKTEENPKTGNIIPIITLIMLVSLSLGIGYYTKKKNLFNKI